MAKKGKMVASKIGYLAFPQLMMYLVAKTQGNHREKNCTLEIVQWGRGSHKKFKLSGENTQYPSEPFNGMLVPLCSKIVDVKDVEKKHYNSIINQ